MDAVAIFEIIAGSIATIFGGYEVIKLFMTRKSVKQAAKLENEKTVQEIATQKNNEMVEHWEKLLAQHEKENESYRTLMAEKDLHIQSLEEKLEAKEETITELHSQMNDMSSENTALRLTRCEKLQCIDRVPPFGFTKIDIKNGQLTE